jgi:hypothetical protein
VFSPPHDSGKRKGRSGACHRAVCRKSRFRLFFLGSVCSTSTAHRILWICTPPLRHCEQACGPIITFPNRSDGWLRQSENGNGESAFPTSCRSNLSNAASVWSASGGHPTWILHLTYLADAVGKKMISSDVIRRARIVPQILSIEEKPGSRSMRCPWRRRMEAIPELIQ